MANGIYSAVSGAVAQMQQLDAVANNLANVSTPGFKGAKVSFAEELAKVDGKPTRGTTSFVKVDEIRTNFEQGAMQRTGNPLDLALAGKGFFVLQNGNEEVFSRGGAFTVDKDRFVVDASGRKLLTEGKKPLQVPQNVSQINIGPDGNVASASGSLGRLDIAEFADAKQLSRIGDTLFSATPAAGRQQAKTTAVQQGYIEKSNVNVIRGVSAMIEASRGYEAYHKIISTFSQIDRDVAARLGRPQGG
jgi:flagellar basal-body rod protein FlgF